MEPSISAAANAAGYLYASGRLRGSHADNNLQAYEFALRHRQDTKMDGSGNKPVPTREAALLASSRHKKLPTIYYRKRRWKPQ